MKPHQGRLDICALPACGPLPQFTIRLRSLDAGPRAVRRRDSECLSCAALRVPLDAWPFDPVAELASFAALTALKHPRRISSRSALCMRLEDPRFSATQSRPRVAPPSGLGTIVVRRWLNTTTVAGKMAGGTQAGRIGATAKRRVPGRARSALREHACGRLSERSEHSERSEFGHGPGSRASQGKPPELRMRPTCRFACANARTRERTPAKSRNGSQGATRAAAHFMRRVSRQPRWSH